MVDLFQNFPFKFDQKKIILNLLHTYVVVLTLDTHNPCSRRNPSIYTALFIDKIAYKYDVWYT